MYLLAPVPVIDSVVAYAYGLTRDQYAHVLGTFNHTSYKRAPRQCLAAFDELQSIGLEAFTKKHDPHWDIALNGNLPQPLIDLPIPGAKTGELPRPHTGELLDLETSAASPGSAKLFADQPTPRTPKKRRKPKMSYALLVRPRKTTRINSKRRRMRTTHGAILKVNSSFAPRLQSHRRDNDDYADVARKL
jgi:hypothetical protein